MRIDVHMEKQCFGGPLSYVYRHVIMYATHSLDNATGSKSMESSNALFS